MSATPDRPWLQYRMVQGQQVSPEMPLSPNIRARFGLSLPLIVMLGAYTHVLFFANRVIGDPDSYWHIAVGRWIIAHRAVPREGIFSATMPHVPWVAHE